MTNNSVIVKRIPSYYVGEDCAQVMIGFNGYLTIMNKDGVFFNSYDNRPDSYVNGYLDDERSKYFPYSNIPTHNYYKFGHKYKIVNQLYNYDESYVLIGNECGLAIEEMVIRDGNEALFIMNYLQHRDNLNLIKRYELEKIFEKKSEDERVYYLDTNGEVFDGVIDVLIPNEKTIKQNKGKDIYELNGGRPIIIVRVNGEDISMESITVDYIKDNCYRINKSSIPLTKYNLNMIKYLGCKIKDMNNIRIPLIGNPNVKLKDIREAKDRIKSLKLIKSINE